MGLLFPFLFVLVGFGQLGLVRGADWLYMVAPAMWLLCFGATEVVLRRRVPRANRILWPAVGFLTGLGLLMVARLAPAFLGRQLVWLPVSTLVLWGVVLGPRNLSWLRRYKYSWLLAGLGLLALTLYFGVNPSGYGARLWLGLGGVFFQPSEPLKILLVVFLAAYLSDRRRQMVEVAAEVQMPRPAGRLLLPHPAYFGPVLLMWGFSLILLAWQRDLGAALLFFCTFLAMLYVALGQGRYVVIGLGLLGVAGVAGYFTFDYVALRIEAWWNPWADAADRSFQIVQSLITLASGGWLGQGLGQGLPTAIPVVHTDFVLAAIAEEYGFIGTIGVLLCFWLVVGQAFVIAGQSQTNFQQLLTAGLGFSLGLQTLVIAGGVLKLMPLTGVTLPFVSYGGSSLLTSFIIVGLLLFASARGV